MKVLVRPFVLRQPTRPNRLALELRDVATVPEDLERPFCSAV
jgi:hypothetical protein